MAKSIRAKCKKRARTIKRNTIGEAQVHKNLRKTMRRLQKVVTGGLPVPTDALTESVVAAVDGSGVIRGAEPIQKVKKLRYTFNTAFREARLREDLEDLTDDEEDLRLGVVPKPEGAAATEGGMVEDDDAEVVVVDVAEESGVRKSSSKPLPKRDNTGRDAYDKYYGRFADTSAIPGLYESDPALMNPKRALAHRKRASTLARKDFWAKKK